MHNEPTDYSTRPLMEPTEIAPGENPYLNTEPYYENPYEQSGPYYQSMPSIPPPPPAQRKQLQKSTLLLWVISIIGSLLLVVLIFFRIAGLPWQQSHTLTFAPTSSSVPMAINTITPIATSTPIVTSITPTLPTTGTKAPYTASQIISHFYQAGLAPQFTNIDTNWSCCQYYPEGGAAYWSDLQTGISMDLATFASIAEAQIDAKNLVDKGYSAYVVNYCLLSYGGNPSNVSSYLNIMNQTCFYQ